MIIAVIPAPGHEALVAPAPQVLPDMAFMEPERPAVLVRCEHCGRWDCVEYGHWIDDRSDLPRALVLHAPGDPKLGMLRAMEATGTAKASGSLGHDAVCGPFVVVREVGRRVPYTMDVPAPPDGVTDGPMVAAWGLAHLLVQRGIAAEVIVLPADKAKEAP